MEKKIESAILKQGMISFLESREPQKKPVEILIVEDVATCDYQPEAVPDNTEFVI